MRNRNSRKRRLPRALQTAGIPSQSESESESDPHSPSSSDDEAPPGFGGGGMSMLLTFSEVKRFASLSDALGGGARAGAGGLDSTLGGGAGAAICSDARKESKVARLDSDSEELLESTLSSSL